MTTKTGLDGKLYVSATTHETGGITWSELDLLEQLGHEDSRAEATFRNRRSVIARSSAGTREIAYVVTCTYHSTDAVVELLRDAYENGTTIALAVMDDDITTVGTKGNYLDVEVFTDQKPEDLDEFDSIEFKLKPSGRSTFEPTRVTIAV